jgi:hypothetical protein
VFTIIATTPNIDPITINAVRPTPNATISSG